MTSINAQHKHCHPGSLGLSEQMGLKYLDSLFVFQSLPLLWPNTWTQLQLNTKWFAFWFTDCIALFFLLEHGSSQLLSLKNWFKICVTNSHHWIICYGVFVGNSDFIWNSWERRGSLPWKPWDVNPVSILPTWNKPEYRFLIFCDDFLLKGERTVKSITEYLMTCK